MEVRAIAKYVRIPASKVKPVADLVRGKDVATAQAILRFTPRKAAVQLLKVLNSALANAQNNHDLLSENLYVKEIYGHQGPVMKRYKAGPRGGVRPILRRSSHLGVVLSEKE